MNFQEWYKSYEPKFVPTTEKIAQDAWEACKREAIKIVREQRIFGMNYLSEHTEMMKKIEKL